MRTNGLTASSYTPVADLDPRLADVVLGELKEQGVAAYVRPVESTSTAGFDRPEFRVDVLDRLYVDAAAADRVRALLRSDGERARTDGDDLAWAQIVAGFDRPYAGAAPWPVLEDLDDTSTAAAGSYPDRDTPRDVSPRREGLGDGSADDAAGSGWRERRTDDEERYVPPPPPPLPKLEPYKQLAWLGVLGGPLLLVLALFFSMQLPTLLSAAAVAGFVAGFITLVATMDDSVDPDDPDSGAVV